MKAAVGITALLAALPPCLGQTTTIPLTSGSVCRVSDTLDFLSPGERAKVTFSKRVHAAKEEFKVGPTCHITNGDEENVPDFVGQFHKSLPHDEFGVVDPAAYEALRACAFSADINVCDDVPSGANSDGAPLVNPLGGTAHQIDGADSDNVFITTPDGVLSERMAAQMAEVYWMALLRDIPLTEFSSNELVAKAAADLASNPAYNGINIPKNEDGSIDPAQQLFRTDYPGVTNGPVVSQLLLSDFVIDTINVPPKQTTLAKMDYMTSVQDWLDVQNGASQVQTEFVPNEQARFISNGRDLSAIAFGDLLYTEAFRAALIMFRQGILSSGEGPYSDSERQVGFATFGEPHILTAMAASSSSTRHAWYAKWQVHRLLRPEAYGGLVHNTLTDGRPNTPLPASLLENKDLLDLVFAHNDEANGDGPGTYLLPMSVAEGSPVHPAFPSGHSINVGAYITTLKAFLGLELGKRCYLEPLVMASADGTERIEYKPVAGDVCIDENGQEVPGLTYEGELNKVTSNVIIGRSHIGVHWRMDGVYGALMGETSAVRRLQEELPNLSEAREIEGDDTLPPATYEFRLYNGKVLKLYGGDLFELGGQLCKGAYTGDDFCEVVNKGPLDHLDAYIGACPAQGDDQDCEVMFCNSIGCPNGFQPVNNANTVMCRKNECTVAQCLFTDAMALRKAAMLVISSAVLLLEGALGRVLQDESSSCNFDTLFSLRSDWESVDDSCHKKLPFELWTLMKAEGSAQSQDALHVRENCIKTQEVGLVELITPEGYTVSESVDDAPGNVVSETEHATTYQGATAVTFEAFCEDDDIIRVTRVSAYLEAYRSIKKKQPGRRLQSTTSEAGQAHQVAELVAGLADLGCTRTMGEDQIVCVMSDSFNDNGNAATLQALGDLPDVEVVKDFGQGGTDEGSAMIELMYDISPGSTYKFNTAFEGEQTFADDIGILASEEMCDVIVDDIGIFNSPAFRDGVISVAVDEAVDSGSLYFSAAGNSNTGYRFTGNFECASGFEATLEGTPACGTGVASHVFAPEATGIARYFYRLEALGPEESYWLHWDAEIGTTQDIYLVLYVYIVDTDSLEFVYIVDEYSGEKAVEWMPFSPFLLSDGITPDPNFQYYMQVVQLGLEVDEIQGDFFFISPYHGFTGSSDGAMFGHACASNAVAVAAMEWIEGDGVGGAFEDPETSPVEDFSSRGPCIVNGETRSKPTTTAADGLSTSTPSFEYFPGTSAAAPVAGAIATLVRAACFPKEVGYTEIMEMLTNYDYTIDYTSDADGAAETWGVEAGHGIISASQMLAWVEANCGDACPGAAVSTLEPAAPTPEPTVPTSEEPAGVTPAPAAPMESTSPPEASPTVVPEDEEPETPEPEEPEETTDDEDEDYVEAGTKTTVSVTASAWDERPGSESGDVGCGEDGCLPALAHDGIGEEDIESRWSCSEDIVPDEQCEIEFTFGSPMDIVDVEVDFFKGDERSRTLKVNFDGKKIGEFDSTPGSITTSLGIKQDGVESVTLESLGIDNDEWISLLEVRFMVEP
eukprot:g8660.t1